MIESQRYKDLIARESRHWGEVKYDPQNPQIWHDARLFEIFFGEEYRRLLRRATECGGEILELGCGVGGLAIELAAAGNRVTAIDLSPQRIEQARANAALRPGLNISFITADLNTASLPPDQYDCIVAHDSLHHILSLGHLCDEILKSLKPGGRLLVMDYVGMGVFRKILAGFLYAVLPTYQPYRVKWGLRHRLKSFLASEETKREAIEQSSAAELHHESPFEEISQGSIVREIHTRFRVREEIFFAPFWFYLAAKLRISVTLKYSAARMFRAFDIFILRLRLARGAYVWIDAQKPSNY